MKILGVDPGSHTTGFAVLECMGGSVRFLEGGILRTRRDAELCARLAEIGRGLEILLARCRPDEAAVEGLFHAINAKSVLKLAHARGVILAGLARAELSVAEYSPLQVKKAVSGYGLADKDALRALVERILSIPVGVLSRDAADAVAVALCHAQAVPLRDAIALAQAGSSSARRRGGGKPPQREPSGRSPRRLR